MVRTGSVNGGTHLGVRHQSAVAHASINVNVFVAASGQSQGSGRAPTGNGANARRVRKSNLREEEADADAGCRLDRGWNELDQPLPHSRQGEEDENETL